MCGYPNLNTLTKLKWSEWFKRGKDVMLPLQTRCKNQTRDFSIYENHICTTILTRDWETLCEGYKPQYIPQNSQIEISLEVMYVGKDIICTKTLSSNLKIMCKRCIPQCPPQTSFALCWLNRNSSWFINLQIYAFLSRIFFVIPNAALKEHIDRFMIEQVFVETGYKSFCGPRLTHECRA